MRPALLLATSLFVGSLQAEPGNDIKAPAPCVGSDCFADLKREGWDQPLGRRTKVTVLKRIEMLNEI